MDKASKIIELLHKVEAAEMSAYHVTRLIYPMGKLKRIEPGLPICE